MIVNGNKQDDRCIFYFLLYKILANSHLAVRRTSQKSWFFSLLPCASSANNLAYCESAEDLGFYLETFGINIDDTGV